MRVANWESILVQHLRDAETSIFVWGENDCALFSATFVDKVLETTYADQFRSKYTTEREANELLTALGFGSVADAITANLAERKNINLAMRGDLVMLPKLGCIGICGGRKSWFLLEYGLISAPTTSCKRSWMV
jgi:hypothetical protein